MLIFLGTPGNLIYNKLILIIDFKEFDLGTGKTTLSQEVAQNTKLNYISITDLAKENNFYLDYDSELESYELDEDKVIDEIDEIMKEGK